MKRLTIAAILSALVAILGNRTSHAQESYQVVCPLFAIFDTGNGWLTYCNAYPTCCDDVPDPYLMIWPDYPEPCDCPDTSGCEVFNGSFTLNNVIRPIKTKVAMSGRPDGLGAGVRIAKSEAAYFIKDDEPVYVRLFDFVFVDDKHLDHTCSLVMGIEMKSPRTGTQGLHELKDVQSTDHPYLFALNHEGRTTYLVRAIGISANDASQMPTPAPAPKADGVHHQESVVPHDRQEKEIQKSTSSATDTN